MSESVFAEFAPALLERGLSVLPIAPGTKRPGAWSQAHGWRGMPDWTRYAERFPTEIEIEHWSTWPDAGICVVLGKLSNVIAIDKDYDLPLGQEESLQSLIPISPIAKKGEKGFTRFFQFNGEKSCSFDVHGKRVLDILSDGRQTVIPPTAHPSGCNYIYLTMDTLNDLTPGDLPKLPDDFIQQVEALLAPFQSEADKKYQRKQVAIVDDESVDTSLSVRAEFYRDLNREALRRLDDWVQKCVPHSYKSGEGYRTIATWRGVKNANVGINPAGIRDWGGNYGMTPIDIIMAANGLTFASASESLSRALNIRANNLTMTVNGISIEGRSTAPMPWDHAKTVPAPIPTAPVVQLPNDDGSTAAAIPNFILEPPGALGDISRWISATAPKSQPELATAAAIALGAAITQRLYVSNKNNYTSLYLVLVAKSTEGKEHPQSCVERALVDAGLEKLLAGSGYTSSGAVFSALLKQPNHIAIIDEIGKLIKMSRSKGNANSEAAIDKLVEAFGKLHSTIRPPIYSTMTLSRKQAAEMSTDGLIIHNPAISLLGATTPATFFENLTDDLISDGFLGRLLVVESSQPRQLARLMPGSKTPQIIIDWMKSVHAPASSQNGDLSDVSLSEIPATAMQMDFSSDCEPIIRDFEIELNKLKDQFEAERLDVLLGRTFEKALRLSMIAAKATDAGAMTIEAEHVQWAIQYVRHYDLGLIRSVRKHRTANQTDGDLKKAVEYIRQSKQLATGKTNIKFVNVLSHGMMPHQMLLKRMHMNKRQFEDLIETAIAAGLISRLPGEEWHYAGYVYCALDES